MEYLYEFINHDEKLPIKIFLHNVDKTPYHWHKELELLFVLDGKISLYRNHNEYNLKKGDLFLFNSYEIHSTKFLEKNHTLVLQIDPEYFKVHPGLIEKKFNLNTANNNALDDETLRYCDSLKRILANIMEAIYKKYNGYVLQINKYLFELIYILVNIFIDEELNYEKVLRVEEERLKRIIKYIDNNYMEDITLSDIAEKETLTSQYLSKYFKDQLGIAFTKYVASVRLNHSLQDLLTTDKRIVEIALQNGFPNAKSYYRVFKEAYNITPTEYRDRHGIKELDGNDSYSYFAINEINAYRSLFSYLNFKEEKKETRILHEEKESYQIDLRKNNGILKPEWKKITSFGRAAEGLRAEWRNQLSLVQRELEFEYVRFHGIFSDEMMVFNKDRDGSVFYNYHYVNELFDFLLENNLKPFVEIGFMPSELASGDKTVFWWGANITAPDNIKEWVGLVTDFIHHLINRYGKEEVLKWYFEIWNEPDMGNVYWAHSKREFLEFFQYTFNAIKSIEPEIKVGGLSLLPQGIIAGDWLDIFDQFSRENSLIIDFFTFHVYSYIRKSGVTGITEKTYSYAEENFITDTITKVINKLSNYNFYRNTIYITEWNSSPDSRDLVHDTCFMAPFLVKNLLKNYGNVNGMAYWTFTDIFEEHKLGGTTFHGGFGLLTYNGLKKPVYHAYRLLNKLGNIIVKKDDNFIVTKNNNDTYQILLYNYCHYDDLYKEYDRSNISWKERYKVFKDSNKTISLAMNGFNKKCTMKTYRINRQNGSVFDEWLKMGSPDPLTKEELNYLKNKSEMDYYTEKVFVKDGFKIVERLQPHEVVLIELIPLI